LRAKCPSIDFLNQLVGLFRPAREMKSHAVDRIEMLKGKLFELLSLQLFLPFSSYGKPYRIMFYSQC